MRETIQDEGKNSARILLVGDSPGKNSLSWGRPFGYYINDLKYWWNEAGIVPDDVYRSYVYQQVPPVPKFDLDLAVKMGRVTVEDIYAGHYRLHDLAESLTNLEVIVPVGDYAMRAFTDHGKTHLTPKGNSLAHVRGSVYEWQGKARKVYKVVGTYAPHQAVVTQNIFAIIADWKRIAGLRTSGAWKVPERLHVVHPTLNDCQNLVDSITAKDVMSIDIETWGNELKCIGFSLNERESLTIPTTKDYIGEIPFGGLSDWWGVIYDLCTAPCDKVMQNGLFDSWWMEHEYQIPIKQYWWDTLAMSHCLNPLTKHSLEYMTSIYTEQPYYKDEAKAADEIVKVAKKGGMDRLYVYNGLDVLVTHEVFQKLYDMIEERGMLDFYLKHYADMNRPLLKLMMGGVPVNENTILQERAKLKKEAVWHRDNASIIADNPLWNFGTTACERDMLEYYWVMVKEGGDIDVDALECALLEQGHKPETIAKKWADMQNKGVSDMMLNDVLYGPMMAPVGKTSAKGQIKADNIALKTLQNVVKDRKRKTNGYGGEFETWRDNITGLIDEVLASRRAAKLSTFVDPKKVDPDGRLRCTYKYTTKSGRLASASNPRGTGMNLQNIDREMRHPFEATKGRVLAEYDLSQAEGRYVKGLTGDPDFCRLARRLPTEGDEHTENAAKIFKVTFEEVSKAQRYLGKRAVHATNYGMRGQTLSDQLLKDGYTFTPKECQAMIDAYANEYPALREWQSTVRRTMLRKQMLFTSWGRQVSFKHLTLDDELFRFGYSWVPQSEIGDLLNQYGLKPLSRWLEKNKMKSEIVLQVHDSVVLNAVPEELYDISCFLYESLSRPRTIGEVYGVEETICMPAEMGIGKTWKKVWEVKYLPSEDELNNAIKEVLA